MKMNKGFLVLVLAIVLFSTLTVVALTEDDIVFPIAELGGCADEDACKTYCDNAENVEACLDFAETYNLMPLEEIEKARIILPFLLRGETPGQCQSEEECDAYCDKEENIMECVEFAKKAGFIDDEEYEMILKTGGQGPGGCKREECDTYCDDEANFQVCVDFAYEHGLIDEEEYEMAKKTGGKCPGGCQSEEECDAYCENNLRECIDFMTEHDLFSEEDKQRMENMGDDEKCMLDCMIDGGLKPGEDCGPGALGGSGCDVCINQCFDMSERGSAEGVPSVCIEQSMDQTECMNYCESNPEACGRSNQGPSDGDVSDLPEDQRCMAGCMLDAGLVPGQDSSGPEFDSCADRCFEAPQEPATEEPGEPSADPETPLEDLPASDEPAEETPSEEPPVEETTGDDSSEDTTSDDSGDDGITGEVIEMEKGESSIFKKIADFIRELF